MFVKFLVNWVKDTLFGLSYLNEYSKEWDQELKELIQEYGDTATTDGFVVTLNDTNVWIRHGYYYYGHKFSWSTEYRPSVLTMYKLRKLQERLDKNKEKEDEDTL